MATLDRQVAELEGNNRTPEGNNRAQAKARGTKVNHSLPKRSRSSERKRQRQSRQQQRQQRQSRQWQKEAKAQAKQTTLSAQAGGSTTSQHQQEPCESCTSEKGTRQVSATTSSLEVATTTIAQGNTNAQDVAQPTGHPQVAFAHLVELCSFRKVTITMLILWEVRNGRSSIVHVASGHMNSCTSALTKFAHTHTLTP